MNLAIDAQRLDCELSHRHPNNYSDAHTNDSRTSIHQSELFTSPIYP